MNRVDISDPAFRYGQGVFETVMVRSGRAQWIDFHRAEWQRAAAALALPAPDLAVTEEVPPGEGVWRWFHTASGSGTWFQPDRSPVSDVVSLKLSTLRVSARSWEARYKTLSYLLHVQARGEADAAGEVVLLNEFGMVASASMANVFWVKAGRLFTPDHEAGCRAGVVRRWVLEQGGEPVETGHYPWTALLEADEVFVTNSRLGICPVGRVQESPKAAGPVTRRLRERYCACVAAAVP